MTQEELDEFKLNAKKNYKKVNQHIRNKCKLCKLGDEPDCREIIKMQQEQMDRLESTVAELMGEVEKRLNFDFYKPTK